MKAAIAVTVMLLVLFAVNAEAAKKSPDLALDLLEEVASSLEKSPNQFHLTVNVTGTQVSNTGGTGIMIAPVGGGDGSTTIGMVSSASSGNVDVALTQVNQTILDKSTKAVKIIREIKSDLATTKPSPQRNMDLLSKLGELVPKVVVDIVAKVIRSKLRLP